jgi:hypothetical protein
MTATSMSRMVLLAFVAACGIPLVLAVQHFRREPPLDNKAATAAPAVSKPASGARDQGPAALAAAQAKADAVAAALAGSPVPPDSEDGVPAFDIARIEPTGEAVIAGRATPGATVELLRNGELHDRAVADQSGQFVMVPPRFPSGTYDLTLRSKQPDGKSLSFRHGDTVKQPGGGRDICMHNGEQHEQRWSRQSPTRMAKSAASANTLVGTLRKIYGRGFAAGYPKPPRLARCCFN